jgi:hypothetical protein
MSEAKVLVAPELYAFVYDKTVGRGRGKEMWVEKSRME